jgi:hypothetical protein
VELTRPGPVIAQHATVPEHLDLDDQRGALPIIDCSRIASLPLKRRRKAGRGAHERGTYSVDFLDLRHSKFALRRM